MALKQQQQHRERRPAGSRSKEKKTGLLLGGLSARDCAAVARRAESRGVADHIWVFETVGRDAITCLASVAFATDRVTLGTGLISIFARNPSTSAMTLATLDELSNGRMTLGLGVSYESALRTRQGITAPQDPFQNLKENLEIMRGILAQQELNYPQGKIFRPEHFRLEFRPTRPTVPLFVGAHNPRMLEFAGEFADGVVLNLVTKEELPSFIRHIEVGARRAGRDPGDVRVASLFNLSLSDVPEVRLEELRRRLIWFLHMKHVLRRLKRTRFEPVARQAEELIRDGKSDRVAEIISDDLISSLCITAPPNRIAAKVDEYRKLGIEIPLLFPTPLGGNSMAAYVQLIKFLEGKRPLPPQ